MSQNEIEARLLVLKKFAEKNFTQLRPPTWEEKFFLNFCFGDGAEVSDYFKHVCKKRNVCIGEIIVYQNQKGFHYGMVAGVWDNIYTNAEAFILYPLGTCFFSGYEKCASLDLSIDLKKLKVNYNLEYPDNRALWFIPDVNFFNYLGSLIAMNSSIKHYNKKLSKAKLLIKTLRPGETTNNYIDELLDSA